jgi:ABC-2 type transport system permease protein
VRTDIAIMDLRLRRRSMTWYAIGMAAYAFLIVAMYPSVASDESLEALTSSNPELMALFGIAGSLTSPVGWVNGNLYANFLPLIVLLVTVGYGASAIAGQSEEGTLGLVATLPVSRTRLLLQKVLALVVLALPVAVVTTLCVLAGRWYDLDLGTGAVLGTTAAVVLLGVDFGLLALAVGAATASRGMALGITSAVAAASYLVSSLAAIVDGLRPLRGLSLFYWAVGDDQLTSGPGAAAWTVLVGVGVVLTLLAVRAVDRCDIR